MSVHASSVTEHRLAVRARVRLLSRVNAHVSGQRTALTEALVALVALVRHLSRVDEQVRVQGGANAKGGTALRTQQLLLLRGKAFL